MDLIRSRVTLATTLFAICIVGVLIYVAVGSGRAASGPAVAYVDFAFEVRDERQLVGDADNVFVGRVIQKVGDEEAPLSPSHTDAAPGSPSTQFRVGVEKNLKGSLNGSVTVSQDSGYVDYVADRGADKGKRVKTLILLNGDHLLEPGQRYLFVTSREPGTDYHRITTPGYGDVPVGDGPNEKRLDPLVAKFTQAASHQINPETMEVKTQEIPRQYLQGEDVPDHHEDSHDHGTAGS